MPMRAPRKRASRIFVEPVETLSVDLDRPAVRPLEPGDRHQQRRFARARRSDEADRLAAPYIERDTLEDMHAGRAAAETQIRHPAIRSPVRPFTSAVLAHEILVETQATPSRRRSCRGKLVGERRAGRDGGRPLIWALQRISPFHRGLRPARPSLRRCSCCRFSPPPPGHWRAGRHPHHSHRRARRQPDGRISAAAGCRLSGRARKGAARRRIQCDGHQCRRLRRYGERRARRGSIGRSATDTDAVLLELGANDMLRGIDPPITRKALGCDRRPARRRAASRCCSPACSPRRDLGQDYLHPLRRHLSRISPRPMACRSIRSFSPASPGRPISTQPDGMHPTRARRRNHRQSHAADRRGIPEERAAARVTWRSGANWAV